MTVEIGFLFVLLAGMIYLFLTEKLPVDLTAFLGLVILIFANYVTPEQAFTGFSSSAVITMLSIFIVSASLLHTGVADIVGKQIHRWVGSREIPLLVTIMLVGGILSAFMNNIAAVAVLMPAVSALGRNAGIPSSRLFMPLAFGAILGGTTTLVGTPPNILAGAMLRDRGLEPFGLFDFTPLGLSLLGLGVVFMLTLGRKLLPNRDHSPSSTGDGGLASLYGLDDESFVVRIPEASQLDGQTLGSTKIGTALGVQVLSIERDGDTRLAPPASTVLEAGDELVVHGDAEELQELLRVQGSDIEELQARELGLPEGDVQGVELTLPERSPWLGRTLKELSFRERHGLLVVGVRREGRLLKEELGDLPLVRGDRLFALGAGSAVSTLDEEGAVEIVSRGAEALLQLRDEPLLVLRLPESSPLVGGTLELSRLGELVGVTVIGLYREDEIAWVVTPDEVLQAGDRLVVTGELARLEALLKVGELELESQSRAPTFESEKVGIVEATLSPRSALAGRTLAQADFRERYGLTALAVWREGTPIRHGLAQLRLRVGDALLLQGSRRQITRLKSDEDLVTLSDVDETPRRTKLAPVAIGALVLMVTLVVAKIQPIQVAAFAAATLVVLFGALKMEEAYRAIEWRAIFLVAAVLPVGAAMESSGAALLIAQSVMDLAGPLGPYAVLGSLILLSSILSQGLDGAPAVVLLTPVVLQAAEGLDLSPYPLMMGVSLAASAAFMTPFSHKANLLVMGVGGYRSMDYVKVGTPLTIVILVLLTFLVPVFFPLQG